MTYIFRWLVETELPDASGLGISAHGETIPFGFGQGREPWTQWVPGCHQHRVFPDSLRRHPPRLRDVVVPEVVIGHLGRVGVQQQTFDADSLGVQHLGADRNLAVAYNDYFLAAELKNL